MKPTPKGWPRLSTAVFYQDARAAIDFLCEAYWADFSYQAVDLEGHCWWFCQRVRG